MKSYEEFIKLERREKFDYFISIVNQACGKKLKAEQRKNYLKTLGIEDYDYWGSCGENFDFKKEYDKIVKVNEIAEKRIEKENKKETRINNKSNIYSMSDDEIEATFGAWALEEDKSYLAWKCK